MQKAKYHIVDDGENVTVEEIEEPAKGPEVPAKKDEVALTPEEIASLKSLAAAAPKLMALIEHTDEKPQGQEGVVETDEKPAKGEEEEEEEEDPIHDAAVETKPVKTEDATPAEGVEAAWNKRCGGNKNE